jgi:hypothetical protein
MKIFYNGRLGFYSKLKRDEVKLLTKTDVLHCVEENRIATSDIIDDATGKEKIWE